MIDKYFNYFTEIEEHLQRLRGTPGLLAPRDWALIEQWKDAGVPLEAVLRGIDAVFENRRNRSAGSKWETINSLAYCTRSVANEAQRMAAVKRMGASDTVSSFSCDEIRAFIKRNADVLRKAGNADLADALHDIDIDIDFLDGSLERLEQRLTAIEEKMIERHYTTTGDEELVDARRDVEVELKLYREKMNSDQITSLEKQFLARRLLAASGLPRLSLFYLET